MNARHYCRLIPGEKIPRVNRVTGTPQVGLTGVGCVWVNYSYMVYVDDLKMAGPPIQDS